ncbi:unnamed protein product [Tilletia controversa]|uniref:Uncharacterized protein n=3 Tax=Tilletia TaxID=13289 RepID=A0A8X7MUQ8_9BASI|nr:hypothetical protein CF336_g3417 [Tilletia laevis]KAE8202164.1 hypothetical protein CF328_g2371 [Tilletia controversa]KAE8261973.1 hypothetical protein A4X03_0g2821 [Tilletia caries]KAE8204606.1 hypothetical protein CF335_g2592 [Tilletia laevis]KAE8249790.1 hypothetical protein A4X06_0g3071 [Tilletia controversa]
MLIAGIRTAARSSCLCARTAARRSASTSTPAPQSQRLVLYRGPPAMKPLLNLLCGTIFIVTGANVAYIASNHLSWPIFNVDPEKNPSKLLPLGLRYATAMGTVLLGLGSGYFFFLVPMRSVTRLTIQPAKVALGMQKKSLDALAVTPPAAIPAGTTMVHIRTSIPSFNQLVPTALIPANLLYSMRTNGWHHPDAESNRDRVVELSKVFRFMGKAADGMSSLEAAKRKMSIARDLGQRDRKSVMLRVGRSRIAYTMESEGGITPSAVNPLTGKPENLYKVFWAKVKHSFRGTRDDSEPTEAEAARKTGPMALPGLGSKEPWFMDRVRFDQLLPSEKHAKR